MKETTLQPGSANFKNLCGGSTKKTLCATTANRCRTKPQCITGISCPGPAIGVEDGVLFSGLPSHSKVEVSHQVGDLPGESTSQQSQTNAIASLVAEVRAESDYRQCVIGHGQRALHME